MLRRLAGGIAMLACCATVAACGSSDDPETTTGGAETPVATESAAPKTDLGADSEFRQVQVSQARAGQGPYPRVRPCGVHSHPRS